MHKGRAVHEVGHACVAGRIAGARRAGGAVGARGAGGRAAGAPPFPMAPSCACVRPLTEHDGTSSDLDQQIHLSLIYSAHNWLFDSTSERKLKNEAKRKFKIEAKMKLVISLS
jgi:hypothetical protein